MFLCCITLPIVEIGGYWYIYYWVNLRQVPCGLMHLIMVHSKKSVATPQQNDRVECKHIHIVNVARALRFQAHLPIRFWGECVLTASYLINRTPSLLHGGKNPYKMQFGHSPQYELLHTCG